MNPFKYGCTVEGEYFCPRTELSRQLKRHVESGQNVVIQGERRMGKTSLVLQTVKSMRGVRLLHADLLCVRDVADLCRRLAAALSRMERSAGFVEKVIRSLGSLRPTLSVDPESGSPILSVDSVAANEITSLEVVMDAIMAETGKHRTCVVLDEFQDILDLDDGQRVLAILRGRIQLDSRTSYVFLGSVRNRMTDIFWNPDSPFYHSAAALPVGEIEDGEFCEFLRGRFATGNRMLSDAMYRRISGLARRTPGYMQEMCDAIWDQTDKGETISEQTLRRGLETIFSRERDHYEIFVRRLTALQMRVLRGIAVRGGRDVYSGDFLQAVAVFSAASVRRALEKLESSGLIFNHDHEYKFVNPFFAEWTRQN